MKCSMAVVGQLGVEGLFVAHGGVGAQAEARGGLAHADSVEVRGLEQQAVGVVLDLGVEAAHDAGDGDRLALGADHQRVFVDVALHAVQRLELERLVEALDLDRVDLRAVERVHRLAELEHQVVRQVGQQVDGAHAAVEQADAHIDRADLLRDVAHLEAGVAVAELAVDDVDVDAARGRTA
jgi:hypothetical protein